MSNFFFGVTVASGFLAGVIVGAYFFPRRFTWPSFKIPSIHPAVWVAILIALSVTVTAALPR